MRKNLLIHLLSILMVPSVNAQLPTYVPTTGLVAWYPFTGNANDMSGNNYNGATSNTTLTTDRDGNPNEAYSFNGGNSYIDCGNISVLNNAPQITLSAWFYSLGNLSMARVIGKEHYQSNSQGFNISYSTSSGNNLRATMRTNADAFGENSTVAINTEEWYHVVMTFDGTNPADTARLKMYINGSEVPLAFTGPIPNVTSSSVFPLWIGNSYDLVSFSQWWGKIDDVGIWSVPLDSQQVADLYIAQDLTVGLDETENDLNSELIISPNPNSGVFDLKMANAKSDFITIDIIDVQGRTVYSESVVSTGQQIDLSELVDGVYSIIARSENGQIRVERFVKSR